MDKSERERYLLLDKLFLRIGDLHGSKLVVIEGCQKEAEKTWRIHGICLKCGKSSIRSGVCTMCDHDMTQYG